MGSSPSSSRYRIAADTPEVTDALNLSHRNCSLAAQKPCVGALIFAAGSLWVEDNGAAPASSYASLPGAQHELRLTRQSADDLTRTASDAHAALVLHAWTVIRDPLGEHS